MSYSISAFVERRENGSDGAWQMCGCGRLEWDCKDILLSEDGCVDDIDGDFCDVDVDDISEGVRGFYGEDGWKVKCELADPGRYWVKTCPLDEYLGWCRKAESDFLSAGVTCMMALGIKAEADGCGMMFDLGKEHDRKYLLSGKVRKDYRELTFPVDKTLFEDWNGLFGRAQRAWLWMGLLRAVDRRDGGEYRIVFVREY